MTSFLFVAEARLERTTSRLWAWRATNCSTPRCSVCFLFASAKLALYCQSTKYISIFFQTKHQYYYQRIIQPSNIQAITINSFVKFFFKNLISPQTSILPKILKQPYCDHEINATSTSLAHPPLKAGTSNHQENTLLLLYVCRWPKKFSTLSHYPLIWNATQNIILVRIQRSHR